MSDAPTLHAREFSFEPRIIENADEFADMVHGEVDMTSENPMNNLETTHKFIFATRVTGQNYGICIVLTKIMF